MAINKIAKNIYININERYYSNAKVIEEVAEKVEIVATEKNITLVSNKKVNVKGIK